MLIKIESPRITQTLQFVSSMLKFQDEESQCVTQVGQRLGGWSCPKVLPLQVPSRLLSSRIVSPDSLNCQPSYLTCPTWSNMVRKILRKEFSQLIHLHWKQILPLRHFLCISSSYCVKDPLYFILPWSPGSCFSCFLSPKQLQCSLCSFSLCPSLFCACRPKGSILVHLHESDHIYCLLMRPKQHDLSLGCDHSCPL